MTNEQYATLPTAVFSASVLLKEGRSHDVYYGEVRTTRRRGDYSTERAEYWFLYQNKPTRCEGGQSTDFVEV